MAGKEQLGQTPKQQQLQWWPYLLGLGAIAVYFYNWVYGNYPLVGHDLAYGIPAMYEMQEAFWKFGKFDFDFSPARCLGLPVFSNPNGLTWSLFHFTGVLLSSGLDALFTALITIILVSFFGALRFCQFLGLRKETALMLSTAWILQGWTMSHITAGHFTYAELLLLPFIFWTLIRPKNSWVFLGASAFWISHLFYTGGYYLLVAGGPGILISFVILRYLDSHSDPNSSRFQINCQMSWKTFFGRLALIGVFALLGGIAKIAGSLDFTANRPHALPLIRVEFFRAILYPLLSLGVAVPMSYRSITQWWFGDWETTLYILPNFILILAYYWKRRWISFSFKPYLKVFGVILFLGFFLVFGWYGEITQDLPVFQSLHVTPRWYAMVLLPFFVLTAFLFSKMEAVKTTHFKVLVAFGWLSVLFTPLMYLDQNRSVGFYRDRLGILENANRVSYCYEPVFGYGLDKFPYPANTIDWVNGPRLDPRCYFKSTPCKEGAPLLINDEKSPQELRDLETYSLEDPRPFMKWLKIPSLTVYSIGLILALVSFLWMLKLEFLEKQ